METKQHVQLPNDMADCQLKPMDQLVYVVIKSFDGNRGCFPSLAAIADRAQISVPSVKKCIDKLEAHEYISTEKRGRNIYYTFNKVKKFEPFSMDFLTRTDLTPTTKAYLIAAQQYMYKDTEGIGKVSYSNCEFAGKINSAESTIRKCNTELRHNGILSEVRNKSRDIETGCRTTTKLFDLDKLGQAIIWKLKEHEERLTYNEERIENTDKNMQALQERLEKMEKQHDDDRKLIKALMEKTKHEETIFTM